MTDCGGFVATQLGCTGVLALLRVAIVRLHFRFQARVLALAFVPLHLCFQILHSRLCGFVTCAGALELASCTLELALAFWVLSFTLSPDASVCACRFSLRFLKLTIDAVDRRLEH